MQNHKKIWDKAEIIAINYMQKKWYNLITTNFKFWNIWEIDLIFSDKFWKIIFVEVKYRSSEKYWQAEESINFYKKKKLLKTIYNYCFLNSISLENISFDVISILKWKTSYKLTHYKNQSLE
jgi:putative endonuclease